MRNALAAVVVALAPAPALAADDLPGSLRLNQIQVIGSHNSYKLAPEPAMLDAMRERWAGADAIDYNHLPLTDQLNLGLRNLELDVYNDPDGGRYAHPIGLTALRAAGVEPQPFDTAGELTTPGFKIIHQADFDYRSTVYAFERALDDLRAWSDANPGHVPVVVTMNCKRDKEDVPNAVEPGGFDPDTLDALDAVIFDRLGRERTLTPDDVRGEAPTLRGAILDHGWPTLAECEGRFLFVLDEGGDLRKRYIEGHPSLRERAFFTTGGEGTDEAAFFVINDPLRDADHIRKLVDQGFIVRTRADADTREARDGSFDRFDAAKACGAQVITTDYYVADRAINPFYAVRFDGEPFARANPVTGTTAAPATTHVVVIGVDGLSPLGIEHASTPNLDAMMRRGSYSMTARAVFPTSSSSNWASMIMGAGPESHGVTSNSWERNTALVAPVTTGIDQELFPTIFGVTREQRPDARIAVIYDWSGFGRLFEATATDINIDADGPDNAIDTAINALRDNTPDLTFVHLDHVDHAGHRYGWHTPPYFMAVEHADQLIGRLLTALDELDLDESTIVLVTSDHGGVGQGHGGESMDELEIPWIIAGPGIAAGRRIDAPISTCDTAPTVAMLLGIDAPRAWTASPVREALASYRGPDTSHAQLISRPMILPEGGLFLARSPRVTITCPHADAEIRYTADGSEPTLASPAYTGPFEVASSATV